MDLASDDIISIYSKGNLTTINKKAQKVLNVGNQDVLDTPASALIPNANLRRALQRQTTVQDKVEKIGEELFVYNQTPLKLKYHIVGG